MSQRRVCVATLMRRDADPWVVRDEDGRRDRVLCGAGRRGVSGFLYVRHGVLMWQGGPKQPTVALPSEEHNFMLLHVVVAATAHMLAAGGCQRPAVSTMVSTDTTVP